MSILRALILLAFMVVCAGCHAEAAPIVPAGRNAATLYGDVDQDSANKVIAQIQEANRSESVAPIFLYINSRGGDILAGGMIVDAMTASRRPIYTVAVGQAASMAAVIHSYGSRRYMAPHAVLMFHNASVGAQDELPHMIQRLTLIYRMWASYEQHIADRAGIPVDEFRAHEAAQWWLTAEDAVAARLADGIGSSAQYPVQ